MLTPAPPSGLVELKEKETKAMQDVHDEAHGPLHSVGGTGDRHMFGTSTRVKDKKREASGARPG